MLTNWEYSNPIQMRGRPYDRLPHFFHNFSTQTYFILKVWDIIKNLIAHKTINKMNPNRPFIAIDTEKLHMFIKIRGITMPCNSSFGECH